jgi:hypothetical protein
MRDWDLKKTRRAIRRDITTDNRAFAQQLLATENSDSDVVHLDRDSFGGSTELKVKDEARSAPANPADRLEFGRYPSLVS